MRSSLVSECVGSHVINIFDNKKVKCKANSTVKIQKSKTDLALREVVSDDLIDGVEVIIGMDMIHALRGVTVTSNAVRFGELGEGMPATCLLMVEADDISDENFHITHRKFSAYFDEAIWTVKC